MIFHLYCDAKRRYDTYMWINDYYNVYFKDCLMEAVLINEDLGF